MKGADVMAKKQLTIEEKLQAALVPVEEQPYKVPENWCWVRLDKLYQVNPKNEDVDEDTRAAFIPMANIDGGLTSNFTYEIQSWKQAKKGHTQMADGDVAFAKISPCFENRKSMIVEGLENGIGGGTTELIILRQPNVNKEYTFWLVSTEEFISKGCTTYSGTVGQQRISMDFVKNYPVPLAPLNEQSRIVARIESLFAKLDEAKEKIQEVLDGVDLRRAAILHQAFTGKLTEKWRRENGVSDESWEYKSIKEIAVPRAGVAFDSKKFSTKGYQVIRMGNLYNGELDLSRNPVYYPREFLDNKILERALIHNDDILITLTGTKYKRDYGYAVKMVNPEKLLVNQRILCLTAIKEYVLSDYLNYYLQTKLFRDVFFSNETGGVNQGNVSSKFVESIVIKVPLVDEQQEIVHLLDNLLSREQSTVTACEEALTTIDTLKKSILARAFRGELGTNDPAEPNAKELLKEILSA